MNTRCSLLIAIGSSAVTLAVVSFAWITQDAHAITRAEILEGYTAELKPAYNDSSLKPAVTAICQLIARRLHPILPDTEQLDYDLDNKQNEYFEKIAIQLDLDRETRGLVAWRIFRDACKATVGNYKEPSPLNGWSHDEWAARGRHEYVHCLYVNEYLENDPNIPIDVIEICSRYLNYLK